MKRHDCIFVAIDTYAQFHLNEFPEKLSYRCYQTDFLLEAVKMSVYAGDYSTKKTSDLMKLAKTFDDPGVRSEDAKENIWFKRKVVNTVKSLIEMNRVTFLRSIDIMEEEPAYEERSKRINYFMMHDKDFAHTHLFNADTTLKNSQKKNVKDYEKYAAQFDTDA